MNPYARSHLSDRSLLDSLASRLRQQRAISAELLADLAEVDARRLYVPAGYPSMFLYCVQELRLSEQAAFHRIRGARTARQYPAVFTALADGHLHLSAVVLLAPYLTAENADELLAAAADKSKSEIERLLAERFPQPDIPAQVQQLRELPPQLSRGIVGPSSPHAPGRVEASSQRPRVTALSPERFGLQLTMSQSTHDKLRHAQELLSHQIPSGDVADVFDRALDALIEKLEKRKFAWARRPRPSKRPSDNPRQIPACVRRAVWERDHGQCTFVSEAGRRCQARTLLEFDHVDEVARGGRASVAGIWLRCRAHNQYGAERTFGSEFMRRKREAARRKAEARRRDTAERVATASARAADEARRKAAEEQSRATTRAAAEEIIPWLRALGFGAGEARRAAARCETAADASLEQRVRRALSYFGPRNPVRIAPALIGVGP